jgi:predicted kinase
MAENKQQEFIIARGIPGSGKSTWAEQWVQEDPFNRVRVNRDDIRFQLSKQLYGKGQWIVLDEKGHPDKEFEGKVTNLEQSLVNRALRAGKSVCSDNTNLPPKTCRQWVQLANRYKIPVSTREFPVTKEEAIRRDAARSRTVGPKVIGMMYSRLGPNGEFHHVDGTFEVQPFKAPEKRGQHAVGFDLDGTLDDVRSVRHFLDKDERGRKNFDMFHRSSLFTPPNESVVEILRDAQKEGYAILITTARGAEYKEVSQRWLHENGIEFDNYYCRAKGDFRPDNVVKDEMYHEISRHYDLVHQVDDNPRAIESFEKNGVLVTKVPFGDAAPAEGPIVITNPFKTGGCLRCGKPLSKGTIGPRCAKKV